MDNRYTVIKDLVTQACERLRKMGVSVDDNDVENMVQNLYSKDYSVEQVKRDVFRMERERRVKYEVEQMVNEPLTIARNLQNLSVQYNGITLNNQDIDLLMIANSNSFEELVEVMEIVTNISLPEGMSEMDFITYRQKVCDAYLDNLSPVNESLINKDLDLFRRIEHLKESGFLTNEEMVVLNKVIMENKNFGVETILTELKKDELFGEEKVEQLVLGLREFVSVEKEGIKSTSMEAYRNLYDQINLFYDSITLDEEAKYGKVILSDGSFYDSSLRKALDFAKKMGKTMRINTLFFYMDCPDDIYNLEESSSSSKLAKEKLSFYIDEITKVLAEYPDVVRSVDVFNELLNRHPLPLDVSYMVRGDIPQDIDNFDNIKSGWLKHLTVEDVCELLAIARKNLPTVDFMYNDDHLIDPDKWSATSALIERIQDYSKGMGVKLIDSIGTQMHIDNDVSKEEIRNMFIELSKFGLPIEITEFDLAMTSGLEGLSDLQIEQIRQKKINEVYEVIEELKDQCNIRGITIWSKTDSQNFRVKLANEELVSRNMEPSVSTLHGGCFTEEMISKSSGFSKNIRKQNFNFHCHTSRCGHAGDFSDRDYVIAAKNAESLRILCDKIKLREIDKRYLTVVHGTPKKKTDLLEGYLQKDEDKNRVYISKKSTDTNKFVKTRYRILESKNDLSLLEIELLTGRTHQIRAHMAAIGHPLLGEGKYSRSNDKAIGFDKQALYSYSLMFDFKTDAGILNYLKGKRFTVKTVWFADKLFGEGYKNLISKAVTD